MSTYPGEVPGIGLVNQQEYKECVLDGIDLDALADIGAVYRCGSEIQVTEEINVPSVEVVQTGGTIRGIIRLPAAGYDLTEPTDGAKRHIATVPNEVISGDEDAVRAFIGNCGGVVINAVGGMQI